MITVKVKICGITNYEDAVAAVDMGADLLGFNFYLQSPRYIEPAVAEKIIGRLPAFVDVVGVFVNSPFDEIRDIVDQCQLNWIQLHGDETPEFCQQFRDINVKIIKAIRVKGAGDIRSAEDFYVDAMLFDAFSPERYGGTGITFDWDLVRRLDERAFLAGGITPDNAEAAIRLGVYGIDVCSGIESSPGKKDHEKMKKLFDNIRHLRA
jgi:phosphoribosylanthranilate isomerase